MKQLFLPFILLFLILAGCSKENQKKEDVPDLISLSLSADNALPGDAIIIKYNKKITSAETNIVLNAITVKGYASGDSAYVFVVPVIASGKVSVSIPGISQANGLELTIKDYTRISNPMAVIDEYVDKRNKSIDSVSKVVAGSNFQPSAQSMILLNQIKEEWTLQMNSLSPGDKELLAYVLQRNMPHPSQYSFTELPAGYYARPGGIQTDVGDKLVAIAKNYVTAKVICLGSIPFLVGSGYAFILAPNPISGLIFLGVFTTFIISREVAIRRAQEVGRLKGVAEAVTNADAQRLTAVEFLNNTEKSLAMSVGFRNLSSVDANIHPDINTAFTTEQTFVNKDKEVEAMYAKATAKTSKLKTAYPSYTSHIGQEAHDDMTLSMEGKNIIVKGVSDPRIGFTTSITGSTKKIKINSTATTEFNFNIQVAYKRTLDGKEFTRQINCLYKPEFDSTALYKASSIGKYRVNNYKGNGPNSELYAELGADGRIVYTLYNDPSWANGTTFGASWTIVKYNGRYYHSQSGFWHPAYENYDKNKPLTYPVTSFPYHSETVFTK